MHHDAQKLTTTALPRRRRERRLSGLVEPRQGELRRDRALPLRQLFRPRRRRRRGRPSRRGARAARRRARPRRPARRAWPRRPRLLRRRRRRPAFRSSPARKATRPAGSACGCSRARPSSRSTRRPGVPWIPTYGAVSPIHRVPSGLPGPGGTGSLSCRPVGRRWVPPGIPPLDDDREAAERCRILSLAGGDVEDALELRPAVEQEPVRAALDHDHRADVVRRHLRLDYLEREGERIAVVRREREHDRPLCGEHLEPPPWHRPGCERPQVAEDQARVDRVPAQLTTEGCNPALQGASGHLDLERDLRSRVRAARALDRVADVCRRPEFLRRHPNPPGG